MKKTSIIAIGALVVAGLFLTSAVLAGNGNDLPSGKHYNLNIIGLDKHADVGDSMGHTLFVKLDGKTRIMMTQDRDGGVFQVTDRNGLDGPAAFNIAPGVYDVYARALGSPKGDPWVNITAYYNLTTDEKGLFLGTVDINRTKGKPQSIKINSLFCLKGEWIFDIDAFESYYWEYDNHKLKLLQVRFYENPNACL